MGNYQLSAVFENSKKKKTEIDAFNCTLIGFIPLKTAINACITCKGKNKASHLYH
jgi:hypothetical protein